MNKDLFTYLSDYEIDWPSKIKFCDTPVKHPKSYPKESSPPLPTNPPESVTFKILNRRVPQFMQSNHHSFHARFYHPGESPSPNSSKFHPREDEEIDMSLPWHVALEDDT